MRNLVFVVVLLLIGVTGCAKKEYSDDSSGGNMQYDSFRGSSSSVVNRVQYEAFRKCIERFDFSKYKGKVVNCTIAAGNQQVTDQVRTLMNVAFIKNGILVPRKPYEKGREKPLKYDYSLDINAVCGGYHFYPGIIFHRFMSTGRLVMLESVPGGTTRYYDSDYQESSLFLPVFTDEFRVSLYILFFSVMAFAAYRCGLFGGVKRNVSTR
jgi:hypothetical protein